MIRNLFGSVMLALLVVVTAGTGCFEHLAPTADFDADTISGNAPLTVQFTDQSERHARVHMTWLWTFGDGEESTEQDPAHVYQDPGTYDVSLTVTTFWGTDTKTETELITVTVPPVADFESDITTGDAPLSVEFTDLSAPGDAPITDWLWDFGDGTQSDEQNPAHVYQNPGTYDVSLTVTTDLGEDTLTETEFITVTYGGEQTVMLPGDVPLVMVWVPAGSFMMGSDTNELDYTPHETPKHEVTLARGFWMGKYEITKEQWEAVMETTPWTGQPYISADPDSPAVYITWTNAKALIAELNDYTGLTFKLPTEAQWEYAARAGTTTRFYWGNDLTYTEINDYAWNYNNAWNINEKYAHVVGLKTPNDFDLYDIIGNAWEWCEDDWHYGITGYVGAPIDGTAWIENPRNPNRIIRGGNYSAYTYYDRTACRMFYDAVNFSDSTSGLRVVK